jgi:Ser/Thr protein kinase RdoA (MazF antagonist)
VSDRRVPVDEVARLLAPAVGGRVQVLSTPVVHHERCVLEVGLPDGSHAFAKADRDADRSAREARVLAAAGRAGVPVPRVLARLAGPPSIVLLADAGGRWLAPGDPPPAWAATGAALRTLHDLVIPDLPWFADRTDWGNGLIAVLDRWAPAARDAGLERVALAGLRAAVDRLIRDAPHVPGLATLHGDCVPVHVRLEHPDRAGAWRVVGLVDLGEVCRGDAAWDLAVLTLRSPERLRDVLGGYRAEPALRARMEQVAPTYRALRHVAEAGWLAEHGFDPALVAAEARLALNNAKSPTLGGRAPCDS